MKFFKAFVISIIFLVGFNLFSFAVTKSRFIELELFNKVLYLVENRYYRKVDTTKLIEGAIQGMLNTLDPHSQFLDEEYFKKMQDDTDGKFGGLGIEVTQKDGVLYVVTPIEDTPAFKAGIKPKDKIVEIDYESIVGLTLNEAIDKMKGEKGSKIHLGILREGSKDVKNFVIKREEIKIKAVKSFLVKDNFAFIRLTQFQRKCSDDIEKSLKRLTKKAKKKGGLKGIILDLRSNPGGLLNEAVDVSSLFLESGIVVSTEERDPKNKDIRYVKKSGYKDLKTPMIVLVNGASASASEIVAGALQDHKRALIMGSRSFGKGSVQQILKIDPNADYGLKMTIAQYMTPKNRKIQAIGINPDIELDEIDASVIEDNLKKEKYLREADLKNHLTATIETKEEKKIRLEKKKKERMARIARAKKNKSQESSNDKDNIFKKYDPNEDYQVLQAVNYLRSFTVFNRL